ncbi:MAG: hypothetical protein OXH31_04725 [Gammaproteobacteria bacterium]|nr:hypothetical protein [Gammaproteobacteria bacterium]
MSPSRIDSKRDQHFPSYTRSNVLDELQELLTDVKVKLLAGIYGVNSFDPLDLKHWRNNL